MKTMINCCMTGDVGECADSIVSSPFVRIDCGSRPNMRVDYWEKSGSIPSGYNLHVPQSRCVTHIDHPKHPYLLYRSPTSVILREKNNVDVNYLQSITMMMYLWLVAEQTFIYLDNLSRSTQDDAMVVWSNLVEHTSLNQFITSHATFLSISASSATCFTW